MPIRYMDRLYNSKVVSLLSLSARKILSLTKTYRHSYIVIQMDKQKQYWKTRKLVFLSKLLQGVLLGQLIIAFTKKDVHMGLVIVIVIITLISVSKWHIARWVKESEILKRIIL